MNAFAYVLALSYACTANAQRCTSIAFAGRDQCGLHCRLSLAAGASYHLQQRLLSNVSYGLGEDDAVATFGHDTPGECGHGACNDSTVRPATFPPAPIRKAVIFYRTLCFAAPIA